MPARPTECKPYERWCCVNFLLSIVFPGAQIHSCLNRVDIQSIDILCWSPSSIQQFIFDQLPGTELSTKDKNLPCLKELKFSEEKDQTLEWFQYNVICTKSHTQHSSFNFSLVGREREKRQVKVVEKGFKKRYALCQVLRANEVAVAQWVMRKTGNSRNTGPQGHDL